MIVLVDYASPSTLSASRNATALHFSANRRRPVRFCGKVTTHHFALRVALRALGEAIWSDDTWVADSDLLDPVITVHPDRIIMEAFSQDQSTYISLIINPDLFEIEGEVTTGTTNIDFTAWLWGALGEIRSSRDTRFEIGSEGVLVETSGAGGRFERKVDLPDSWVRGFLQVQAAMAMPGTRIAAKPVDLLSAIRFLQHTKAKVSPRALRYEFHPGEDVRLVLEPWEQIIPLVDATHSYSELKTTRVWGRRRLRLIEGLLPFAQSVDIYLKGRALPSFYAVKLPGITFTLGLTGWSGNAFTTTGGFNTLTQAADSEDVLLEPALGILRERHSLSTQQLAQHLGIEAPHAAQILVRLCRQGRCMFDVEARRYRHRELFESPADETRYFPPDRRQELALQFIKEGKVTIDSCVPEETTKITKLSTPQGVINRRICYRDWRVLGKVDDQPTVEVVVNDTGQIIFGRCNCEWFREHLLNRGPCEHILALYHASNDLRQDSVSSESILSANDF